MIRMRPVHLQHLGELALCRKGTRVFEYSVRFPDGSKSAMMRRPHAAVQ